MSAITKFCSRFRLVFVVLLLAYAGFSVARAMSKDRVSGDFEGMWKAASRLAAGDRVYFPQLTPDDEMPNKHGLVFLELLRPLTELSLAQAQAIWIVLSILMLVHSLFVLSRMLAWEAADATSIERARGSPIVALALVAPFAHLLVKYAQTGFFLLWLLVLAAHLCQRRRELVAGALFGITCAIKLFPLVLLPWALWTGRIRVVLGMLIGIAAAVALSIGLHGVDSVKGHMVDYRDMLRVDAAVDSQHPFHQSLRPLVLGSIAPEYDVGLASEEDKAEARAWNGVRNFAANPRLWGQREVVVALASLFFALLCAWAIPPFFSRRKRPHTLAEIGLVLAVMILISPLAWKHYYVWAIPALAWATFRGGVWASLAWLVWLLTLTLPHKGLLGSALAGRYAVFHGYAAGLALFCIALAVAVRVSKGRASAVDAPDVEETGRE